MSSEELCGLIVRRDGEYLVGRILCSNQLRWSRSPFDAARTRNWKKARALADKVGGELVTFNPITGTVRG